MSTKDIDTKTSIVKRTVQDVKIPEKERRINKPNESYTIDHIQEVDMSDEEILSLAMKIWGMKRAETDNIYMHSCLRFTGPCSTRDSISDITDLREFLSGIEWE